MAKKDIMDVVENLFEEPVTKAKGKVHYLRFDTTPLKLADGKTIEPATEGWSIVATMLGATEPKDMLRRLIGLALLIKEGKAEFLLKPS